MMGTSLLLVGFLAIVLQPGSEAVRWPGTSCKDRSGPWYMVDSKDTSIFYQCVHGKPVKMDCAPTGTCPCIGANNYCDQPEGSHMQCGWLKDCHVWDNVDVCYPNPCKNGGKCRVKPNGKAKCKCPKGYTGKRCQKDAPVKGIFKCVNSFTQKSGTGEKPISGSVEDYEDCDSWCYVRENSDEQTVTRGCWYTDRHNMKDASVATDVVQKGCSLISDDLQSDSESNLLCFCKHGGKECNEPNVDKLLKSLPYFTT